MVTIILCLAKHKYHVVSMCSQNIQIQGCTLVFGVNLDTGLVLQTPTNHNRRSSKNHKQLKHLVRVLLDSDEASVQLKNPKGKMGKQELRGHL